MLTWTKKAIWALGDLEKMMDLWPIKEKRETERANLSLCDLDEKRFKEEERLVDGERCKAGI